MLQAYDSISFCISGQRGIIFMHRMSKTFNGYFVSNIGHFDSNIGYFDPDIGRFPTVLISSDNRFP